MKSCYALVAVAFFLMNVAAIPVANTAGARLIRANFDLERRQDQEASEPGAQIEPEVAWGIKRDGHLDGHSDVNDIENGSPALGIKKRFKDAAQAWATRFADPQKYNRLKRHGQTHNKNKNNRRVLMTTTRSPRRDTKPTKRSSSPFFVYL
ncbi:MAG: hypothetical protein M1821_007130 [Bathelium mastoideum]|nr:MAG: hypothetical protein M1821_007130 [Bathelium mastoideum]KAI9694640.1 MAG: hypothetical protein M1822_000256 [Bathelium mastoideum]